MLNLKRHDTGSPIKATLRKPDGSAVDLTGATLTFIMAKKGTVLINREASITDATNGKVRFTFLPEETVTLGVMKAEFEVTYSDGSKETFPNSGYIPINFEADLGTPVIVPAFDGGTFLSQDNTVSYDGATFPAPDDTTIYDGGTF